MQRAVEDLAHLPAGRDGVPGVVVLVDRNGRQSLYRAGSSVAGGPPIDPGDRMRLASVAKAYSGAVAFALVAERRLSLRDTVGKWLPSLPKAWSQVTLAELLQHTSGIPDFSETEAFRNALLADPLHAPPPIRLLSFASAHLLFAPGREYHYSNSDNVIVGLMAEAASGHTYEQELEAEVLAPLGLGRTSLPRGATLDEPFVHGYALDPPNPPEDVTEVFAAGWSWASGGLVSTPAETDSFVRAYVRGEFGDRRTRSAQFEFRPGSSQPPGPGKNSAGLALFRYQTSCGTVYGHTGNTAGFTQFAAASSDGR
ncbi:MAG TPA: serine hydrolase domain-containing protein, partial [Acidimicrobiales bacterium]|nr:serine hydrolase domain-containing protein [Acidimicrobiales bacterium]